VGGGDEGAEDSGEDMTETLDDIVNNEEGERPERRRGDTACYTLFGEARKQTECPPGLVATLDPTGPDSTRRNAE
jgi:hypothetical protein